ncbi:MAG: glycosyltransferase family 2 protein, partial [Solirubrobacteraceae bacterium]
MTPVTRKLDAPPPVAPSRGEPPRPPVAANTPRVAVVIPCYAQAEFLPDTVASVCAQTYRELEIVIVDDGSPDHTAQVTERLIAAHANRAIGLLRQANQGLAASRNSGIAASGAEYVLPLDADDLLSPGFVEDLVRALDARPDLSIAYGSLRYFGEIDEFHVPS